MTAITGWEHGWSNLNHPPHGSTAKTWVSHFWGGSIFAPLLANILLIEEHMLRFNELTPMDLEYY